MKIYNFFIPNKKNKFHPSILRSTGLVIFSILFVIIPTLYNALTAHQFQVLGYSISISINELNEFSNQERINVGLSPLSLNSQLNSAAYAKAQDMFADNYWAHVAPDGTEPWSFIINSGYDYTTAGENLAKNFSYSQGVVSGWMASEGHRANVMNPAYQDVGYAIVNGVLLGEETTLVVAMYGQKNQPVVVQVNEATASAPQPEEYIAPANVESVKSTPPPVQEAYVETAEDSPPNSGIETEALPIIEIKKMDQDEQIELISSNENENFNYSQTDQTQKSGIVAGIKSLFSNASYQSLNWGQKASLLVASTLILLYVMKHTLVWRAQKRGHKNVWLRGYPSGQIAILITAIIATLINSIGVVL